MNFRDAPAIRSGEVKSYVDEPDQRYTDGLRDIMTAKALRAYLAKWPFLAADAIEQAAKLKDKDVRWFQANRMKEGAVAVQIVKKCGAILMPGRLLTLTLLKEQFKVPAGCVYIRLWETEQHDRLMKLEEPGDAE